MKTLKIFTTARTIFLIICLFLALIAIHPRSIDGVAIRGVELNTSADFAGIEAPSKNSRPLGYEVILSLNGNRVSSVDEYYSVLEGIGPDESVSIKTDKSSYFATTIPLTQTITTDKLVNQTVQVFDNQTNSTINQTILVNETITSTVGVQDLGISVSQAPTSNIKKGLDLAGGIRVLLEPEEPLDDETLERVTQGLEQRVNAFGLADVTIRTSKDLSGNAYILVEIAGLQKQEVTEMLTSQGVFEAKIANTTVFTGGEDITYVCRSAQCSGIDPYRACGQTAEGVACSYFFTISLTPEAAQRQADVTRTLGVIPGSNPADSYLSDPLDLYLDGTLTDSLNIGSSLKGRATTTIQISGSGTGSTEQLAVENSLERMNQMQAILETGSLPVKLKIAKIDTLSPVLGEEFTKTAITTGIIALLAVAAILLLRYRTLKIAIPAIITSSCEVFLVLGSAALLGTNLDLAAIAGIIIVVGTSVDHQIVIADEVLKSTNRSQGVKDAFFIIFAAFSTTFVAMVPLWFAGAGILKGFALTTIIGVSIGVFITRPAFARILDILYTDEE